MHDEKLLHKEMTDQILKIYYLVYNELGYGFLEKVYERALAFELLQNGFSLEIQNKINVKYKDFNVGFYIADIIVEKKVILEIKACEYLQEMHEFQLINYLKATECEVGLLLNFGKKPQFSRKVFSNYRK